MAKLPLVNDGARRYLRLPKPYRPEELSRAEAFYAARKRSGRTQAQAALKYNVDESTVIFWERGDLEAPEVKIVGELTWGECCRVARRRKGWTIAQLRQRAGFSKPTINKMENRSGGRIEYLIRFWEERGWPSR